MSSTASESDRVRGSGALADPGWYPDPADDDPHDDDYRFRWWTGTAWTAWLATDPDAPPPPHGSAEYGPQGAAEAPPAPRARFGTVPRVMMGVVVIVMVVAAVVVAGWPERDRLEFTYPDPSTSYQPQDLTVSCATENWRAAGVVAAEVAGDFSVRGPDFFVPFDYLQCRTSYVNSGGNTLICLGLADDAAEFAGLQQHAESLAQEFAETIYERGPVEAQDVTSQRATDLDSAWLVSGALSAPGSDVVDRFEIVVFESDSGPRVVWVQLIGDEVTSESRAAVEQARASLRRI